MRHPLAVLTFIFCSGIILASKIRISFPLIYASGILCTAFAIFFIRRGRIFEVSLYAAVFLFGAISYCNFQILPRRHILRCLNTAVSNRFIVKGVVATPPEFKASRTAFIIDATEIASEKYKQACTGKVLIFAPGRQDLEYGQEAILKGKLSRPYRFAGAGRASYNDYLSRQGIFLVMRPDIPPLPLKNKRGPDIKRFALRLKGSIENIFYRHTSCLCAAILEAMVLGEKRNVPPLLYQSMIKSGTVHILVVSGFNVGIVAFIILLLFKVLRLARKIRIILASPLLVIYCLVTGASTPVIRATVMTQVFLFAYLFKREPDIYHSLAIAALFILSFNPNQLFDIGFQLSFMSVFSIVYFYPRIKSWLRVDRFSILPLRFLAESAVVSLSAWLGTAGFIAYYFKIFSPLTILANMFIVPLATLITLCGFGLAAAGLFCPLASAPFSAASEFLAALLLRLNFLLVHLPGAYIYL
jgi:competence protein ComEC